MAAAKRDGAGVPCCHPALGGVGKVVPLGRCEGRGVLELARRKAALRCLCGLFKQLEDPPSNQRKSCHRHPQQAIKSDFPFQGSLVPLLGFSPLCTHTHQAERAKNRLWVAAWEISGYRRGQG